MEIAIYSRNPTTCHSPPRCVRTNEFILNSCGTRISYINLLLASCLAQSYQTCPRRKSLRFHTGPRASSVSGRSLGAMYVYCACIDVHEHGTSVLCSGCQKEYDLKSQQVAQSHQCGISQRDREGRGLQELDSEIAVVCERRAIQSVGNAWLHDVGMSCCKATACPGSFQRNEGIYVYFAFLPKTAHETCKRQSRK